MDEHKISDQFRDAVGDVPPATFTSDDVAAGAHRANVRRRNTIIAGSAFAVAILAGGVAVGASAWTGHGSDNSAAAASAPSSNTKAGPYEMSTETGQQSKSLVPSGSPSSSGKQGPDGSGKAGPPASSASQGCDAADGKLAAALAGELPSAPSLDQRRLTSSFTC